MVFDIQLRDEHGALCPAVTAGFSPLYDKMLVGSADGRYLYRAARALSLKRFTGCHRIIPLGGRHDGVMTLWHDDMMKW